MYVHQVYDKVKKGDYQATMERPQGVVYRENHVFDEDKSVKWNREELVRKQEEQKKSRKDYQLHVSELMEQMENDYIEAIMYETSLNKQQAGYVFSHVRNEKDSHNSVYHGIETMVELVNKLEELKSEEVKATS